MYLQLILAILVAQLFVPSLMNVIDIDQSNYMIYINMFTFVGIVILLTKYYDINLK